MDTQRMKHFQIDHTILYSGTNRRNPVPSPLKGGA